MAERKANPEKRTDPLNGHVPLVNVMLFKQAAQFDEFVHVVQFPGQFVQFEAPDKKYPGMQRRHPAAEPTAQLVARAEPAAHVPAADK